MAKSITVKRKKAGRPATGTEPLYGVRISDDLMGQIQKWGRENSATRSEAIRRLVELGLTVGSKSEQPTARAARAKDLASRAIDSLTVGTTDNEAKASRKRRLIKGPEEFQEDRVDLPKPKATRED
jgi:hypothetical protein